jgi:predicted phosphodiesterase
MKMGKTLLFSDVHANIAALESVLQHAFSNDKYRPDECWFLGDLMGYGPSPEQVFRTMKSLPIPPGGWLAGNHDWGVTGRLQSMDLIQFMPNNGDVSEDEMRISHFRRPAWDVIQAHRNLLEDRRPDILDHLRSLPIMSSPRAGVYLAHGDFAVDGEVSVGRQMRFPTLSPDNFSGNFRDAYLTSPENVFVSEKNKKSSVKILAFGHTHKPGMWRWDSSKKQWEPLSLLHIHAFGNLSRQPIILSPGSVGFPRDTHRCPTYVLIDWDHEIIFFRHVHYDASYTLNLMEKEPYSKLIGESGFWTAPNCKDLMNSTQSSLEY